MKKILSQIGIKSILKKDEMKIYGKGTFDAHKKHISVGNLEITEWRCALLYLVL